jgi:hypothetical protein
MIFSKKERSSLALSLHLNGFQGHLYVGRNLTGNSKLNKLKLIKHYQDQLDKSLISDWKLNRLSSWSHSRDWIGLWVSSLSFPTGLDIEKSDRINLNLLKRIYHANDQISFSHPMAHFLWGIKESAFKALSLVTPIKTISQVYAWDLKKLTPLLNQHSARARFTSDGPDVHVLCFQKNNFYFCIAQALPNRLNP